MKKILIFENEYNEIEGVFEAVKIILDDQISIEVKKSSQEFGDMKNLKNYHRIFVDLDLVGNSKLTGYEILKLIKENHSDLIPFVFVITGHSNAKNELTLREIDEFVVIEKPIRLNILEEKIRQNV